MQTSEQTLDYLVYSVSPSLTAIDDTRPCGKMTVSDEPPTHGPADEASRVI